MTKLVLVLVLLAVPSGQTQGQFDLSFFSTLFEGVVRIFTEPNPDPEQMKNVIVGMADGILSIGTGRPELQLRGIVDVIYRSIDTFPNIDFDGMYDELAKVIPEISGGDAEVQKDIINRVNGIRRHLFAIVGQFSPNCCQNPIEFPADQPNNLPNNQQNNQQPAPQPDYQPYNPPPQPYNPPDNQPDDPSKRRKGTRPAYPQDNPADNQPDNPQDGPDADPFAGPGDGESPYPDNPDEAPF